MKRTLGSLRVGDEFVVRGTLVGRLKVQKRGAPSQTRCIVVLDGDPIGAEGLVEPCAFVEFTGACSPNFRHDDPERGAIEQAGPESGR